MFALAALAALLAGGFTGAARPLAAQEPAPPAAPLTLAERAARTMVQPGDRVDLKVFREPDLGAQAVVDVDGGLALPRLGTIATRGLSVAALHDTLRARYATFLRTPAFELSVMRRVVVNGAVRTPGVYYVDIASTLRDVVAIAGGMSERGDRRRVTLVRDGRETSLQDWERTTTEIQSGDQVLVGERSWLSRNALALTGTATAVASVIVSILVVTR